MACWLVAVSMAGSLLQEGAVAADLVVFVSCDAEPEKSEKLFKGGNWWIAFFPQLRLAMARKLLICSKQPSAACRLGISENSV